MRYRRERVRVSPGSLGAKRPIQPSASRRRRPRLVDLATHRLHSERTLAPPSNSRRTGRHAPSLHVVELHKICETLEALSVGAMPVAQLLPMLSQRHNLMLRESRLQFLAEEHPDHLFFWEPGASDSAVPSVGEPSRRWSNLSGGFHSMGPWLISKRDGRDGGQDGRAFLHRRLWESLLTLAEGTDVRSRRATSRWLLLGLECQEWAKAKP